jgi:4-hydroxybenzoate polyprenyltransferase
MSGVRVSRAVLYLRLGRVSNLPTVWTNTLAGVVLAGGATDATTALGLAALLSLFYVGGMFLNDAFDRTIDARERPERPIPSGQISAAEVFVVGFGLVGAGIALLAVNALVRADAPWRAVMSGVVLAGLIVLYDAWHKANPLSPVVMGLCRTALYVTAGLGAGGHIERSLVAGALVVGAYVVGLTFVARQENRRSFRAGGTLALILSPVALSLVGPAMGVVGFWALGLFVFWVVSTSVPLFRRGPVNVPRAVVRLIAGISLADALLIAAHGPPGLSLLGVAGFLATLLLQRWVRGT